MAAPLRVVVTGASGKMAREVLAALCRDPEVDPVGAVSTRAVEDLLSLPEGGGLVPISTNLEQILTRTRPDVLVDFTTAAAVLPAARAAALYGVSLVIGTSGLGERDLAELERLARDREVGVAVIPNFAIGAVLMTHLARIAARYFDYAELVEAHHEQKIDAPSGTALAMARAVAAGRAEGFRRNEPQKQTLEGTRGGQIGGIGVHSLRLPGVVANHELTFGGLGQTFTLRHDTISREAFMPGVLLAIKEMPRRRGYIYGLESLLGFEDTQNGR
jgi:4-hydroxy-tetrahydrodipicolinate reductase